MASIGDFRINGGVPDTFRVTGRVAAAEGTRFLVDKPGSRGAPGGPVSTVPTMTISRANADLQAASTALANAFRALHNETRDVYSSTFRTRGPVMATASGLSARLADVTGGYAVLDATEEINTGTSTLRSSSSMLGLDVVSAEGASTITSTAEMNERIETSYGSSSLTFTGSGQSSSSTGTLTGEYTGVGSAADATSLVVNVKKSSTLNLLLGTNVQFEVRDQNGDLLFDFDGSLKADQSVYLGDDIGLSIKFSTGQLVSGHSDSTTVSHDHISVSTSTAFNDDPGFESGAGVTGGSFTVNGVAIAVYENDSIDSVLVRINGSGAGVTASVADDRITLTSNGNSEDDIVLGNDTSGFLNATKLAGASTVAGNVRDDEQVFSKSAQFASVSDGSVSINGVSIAIDADGDSLASVIQKINSSGAGVTASYDNESDKLVLTPDTAGAVLSLEADTSGFLAAAAIAAGTAGTRVNANGAFNATGLDGPLFDPGQAVSAGSFTVNGVTISVAADDTLNSVLAKITASTARVTATFDEETELVTLTANDENSGPVTVGNDTSGFLAAVKLDGAEGTSGSTAATAFAAAFHTMTEYAGVQAGTLTVNGQQISIDPESSTIENVVAALDSIDGLSASLDETTGAVSISATAPGAAISFSDTSGLLSVLGIDRGTYKSTASRTELVESRTGTETVSNAEVVATDVQAAVERLNQALSQFARVRDERPLFGELAAAVQDAFRMLSDAGVQGMDFSADQTRMRASADLRRLESSLALHTGELDGPIERFVGRIAAAAPSEPEPSPARYQLGDLIQFQTLQEGGWGEALVPRSEPASSGWNPWTSRRAVHAYSASDRLATNSSTEYWWES